MILITRTQETPCLTLLKNAEGNTYDDLKGLCKNQVTEQLAADQKHLCAYCQRRFTSIAFIEHYIPQSIDSSKQLDYNNFLGVCSGKYYVDKKTGEKIIFCSVKRGNMSLEINPSNPKHIHTIFYDENFKICSENPQFQQEFDEILNLNFDELCLDRIDSFEKTLKSFQNLGSKMGLSPIEIYTKAIKFVELKNPEFSGFLSYKYKKLLDYYKNNHLEG